MSGISYITDQKGNKTHLILDLSIKHQKEVLAILEELEDLASVENANIENAISLSAVKDFIISQGVSEQTLSPITEDV